MQITDAQIGVALEAFDHKAGYSKIEKMRAALEAALLAGLETPAGYVTKSLAESLSQGLSGAITISSQKTAHHSEPIYLKPVRAEPAFRPLKWVTYNIDMHKADTFYGSYVVTKFGMWWLRGVGNEESRQCENLQKAFEEAQEDYQMRIRSALA
ncbi:hypothetical protein D3C80_488570 [compost metagenome]